MDRISEAYLEELRRLMLDYLNGFNVKVYLVGSRAKDSARRASDVDIAIQPLELLPSNLITNLRTVLEESNIPYRVDIIDLSEVDDEFRNQVLMGAKLWKG